jgi:hypothetical protein
MQQNPSCEANSISASRKLPRLLWNTEVHYSVHKNPPLVSILSQINTFHNLPSYFSKIRSNIILPSMPRSSEWSLPFRFSDHNFVCVSHLSNACNMSRPSHPPSFEHCNNTWLSIQVTKLLCYCSTQRNFRTSLKPSLLNVTKCHTAYWWNRSVATHRGANWCHTSNFEHENSKIHSDIKGKMVKLSLCLTKHHAMKTYRKSGGIAPRILWPRH